MHGARTRRRRTLAHPRRPPRARPDPRLQRRGQPDPRAATPLRGRHDARQLSRDGERAPAHPTLRHSPERSAASGARTIGRQPPQDRRCTRDGTRLQGTARRSAHARRRRRRNRVHSRTPARSARSRKGHPARLGRSRRSPRPRRPRGSDVRRTIRRRATARRGDTRHTRADT